MLNKTFSNLKDRVRLLFRKDKESYLCFYRMLGFYPHNIRYYEQALLHKSFSAKLDNGRLLNNERLEFLGDAVLELVSSEFLFRTNPDMPEGQLTRTRASMVCEPALAYCARDLELNKYIRLGKGEEMTGGRYRDSIISDVMEAVIGSLYLDGGFGVAHDFIHRFILSDLENKILFYDAKTVLQEIVQKTPGNVLTYELISEEGPDHNKLFRVEASINGKALTQGCGRTKKAAEQQAAYDAILYLRKQEEK